MLGRSVATPRRAPAPAGKKSGGQLAPGQLARHYSPRTPLVLHGEIPPSLWLQPALSRHPPTAGGALCPDSARKAAHPRGIKPLPQNSDKRLRTPANEAFLFQRRPRGAMGAAGAAGGARAVGAAANVFWLDASGRLPGVARGLFAMLRRLDARGFARIHAELAPERGLGRAINDRLRRAAAR